jgi:SAM-dependent methyltransferase
VLQRVPGVYRSGEGLPYPEYGADCRLAIANFNRPMFVNDLAGWFATVPEVQARLEADGTRVLDVGCGIGWSSISLARAFLSLRVDGIDADEASIAEAQRLAAEAGVCLPASRVEAPSAAAGTALRSATVRDWSDQAGCASLRVLPVDHVFWRFYQLAG